jgi:hypothetical protein
MVTKAISCRWRSRLGVWLGVVLITFSLCVQAQQATGSDTQRNTFARSMPVWQLSNFRVTDSGLVSYPKEGKFTRQYILQADALSTSGNSDPAQISRFKLTMDVFSPNYDMGLQKQGKFYVQGRWELTGLVGQGALTGDLYGRLQAELDFDPSVETRDWKASLQVPMSRANSNGGRLGIRPVRGAGELAFVSADSGELALNMKLWPRF